MTGSRKTSLICTTTEIHFLSVRERCTHALPRNTKYLTIDGRVCFTDDFLSLLSNHKDTFLGSEGH